MYAKNQRVAGVAAVAAIASVIFTALFALQSMIPLAWAANQIAPNVILSLTVSAACEISLAPNTVSFGTIIAGQNSIWIGQNVLDTNNGNSGAYMWTYGGNWIGGASSFGVGNTQWDAANVAYGGANALTTISANTNILVGIAGSSNIFYGLGIPAGQPANVYTQNIIISNVC